MAIRKSRPLEGQTALITGGGEGIGRAIALALAARGVRIVVAGRDERALGETVGEIAHAGGKGLDIAIASSSASGGGREFLETNVLGTYHLFGRALGAIQGGGRLIATSYDGVGAASAASASGIFGLVRATAREVGARGITCNAITAADDADAVAELVVFLCASTGDSITGQSIAIGDGAPPLER
jgi:NAD(P)-dependent dehydrogenase (short-subunit alcohol dehydrogenase family)